MIPKDWRVGDVVTRDGSDEQRILAIDHDYQTLVVRCIKEPNHEPDVEPWIKIGQEESNLIRRYQFVRRDIKT